MFQQFIFIEVTGSSPGCHSNGVPLQQLFQQSSTGFYCFFTILREDTSQKLKISKAKKMCHVSLKEGSFH